MSPSKYRFTVRPLETDDRRQSWNVCDTQDRDDQGQPKPVHTCGSRREARTEARKRNAEISARP